MKVETTVLGGVITQRTVFSDDTRGGTMDSIIRHVCERVVDTQEQQVREGLIALGWTPPKSDEACRGCKNDFYGEIAPPTGASITRCYACVRFSRPQQDLYHDRNKP